MIETKQLQYLVVCAQLRSFSKAAEALYTTQPNVSKVIRMLEDELGFPVFVRQSRGITLTARGQRVYEYANRAVENIEQLKSFSRMDKGEELMPSFQYRLECAGLIFQELKRTKAYLYFGKDHPLAGKSGIEEIALDEVRLVQCYEDEYTLGRRMTEETDRISPADCMKISVITNSDYVMNELLRKTDLGNVSGGYLSREKESRGYPGYSLYGEKEPILFGCVSRQGETLDGWAEHYLEFVRSRLQE